MLFAPWWQVGPPFLDLSFLKRNLGYPVLALLASAEIVKPGTLEAAKSPALVAASSGVPIPAVRFPPFAENEVDRAHPSPGRDRGKNPPRAKD